MGSGEFPLAASRPRASSRLRGQDVVRDLLIAVATVTVVSLSRLLLAPVLQDRAAFLLYGLAIMICSWIGGQRLGLMATALAVPAGTLLFVRPYLEASPLQVEGQIILFVIEGLGISLLAGGLRGARVTAEQEAENASRSRAELLDLVQSLDQGFQAFDPYFRLTFMNRAAENILGQSVSELVGRTFWEQFPNLDASVEQRLRQLMLERVAGSCETYYEPWGRWFAFRVHPFRGGVSMLFADITEQKNSQSERERLIEELQAALSNIRTLRGLIPICAWCKKIRNDSGYWEQLELYLKEHSEANFTHGMCPDCVKQYAKT